jgi:hypothetical protein
MLEQPENGVVYVPASGEIGLNEEPPDSSIGIVDPAITYDALRVSIYSLV